MIIADRQNGRVGQLPVGTMTIERAGLPRIVKEFS